MPASHLRYESPAHHVDPQAVLDLLKHAYWGQGRTVSQMQSALDHSTSVAAYDPAGQLVGYLRAITDTTTFAYVTDVIVHPDYRGQGVGQQLMSHLLATPPFDTLRRVSLITEDAQSLYRKFGFAENSTHTYMEIIRPY